MNSEQSDIKKWRVWIALLIFLLLWLLSGIWHEVEAATNVSGVISSDTIWSAGTYVIQGNVTIDPSVTLTLSPGVVIKMRNNSVENITVNGNLVAQGNSVSRVVFTSENDENQGEDVSVGTTSGQKGDWNGIKINSSGSLTCSYCYFAFAGYNNSKAIFNDGGQIKIDNSTIENNKLISIQQNNGYSEITHTQLNTSNEAFSQHGGTALISNNEFKQNLGGIEIIGANSSQILNNKFIENDQTGFINETKNFIHEGNTSSDKIKGFEVVGVIQDGTVWNSNDLPTLITTGNINIPSGHTLTIQPGTIIKIGGTNGIGEFSIRGNLISEGTKEKPIYFTSIKDDSIGGDTNGDGNTTPSKGSWVALFFENGASGSFKYTNIKYAGSSYNSGYLPGILAALYNRGANLTIEHSYVGDNSQIGIFQDGGSTSITNSQLANQQNGYYYSGGQVVLKQNSFHQNINHAVHNTTQIDVDATNNWWGDPSGPHDPTKQITGSGDWVDTHVLYDPWLTSDPLLTPINTKPVIIVPGIMGSYLHTEEGKEVWMNIPEMISSIDDSYLNNLMMSNDGNTINNLTTTDVIKGTVTEDFFIGLQETLQKENDVYYFSYDWRVSNDTISQNFSSFIDEVINKTSSGKVTIISHSMGGLLFKSYLNKFGGEKIDKFIDLGTPHLGAPKSFKILEFGDDLNVSILFGLLGMNQERIKVISQNMPSVYELLPSSKYINQSNYIYDLDDLDGNGIRGALDYVQTKSFLKNTGRNGFLVDKADSFHSQTDDLNPKDYGVKTYNIVGCGTPTLGKIFVLNKENSGGVEYNISYINGDGTVPLISAKNLIADHIYFYKNAVHALMPSSNGVKELIAAILNDQEINTNNFNNVSSAESDCPKINGHIVSFHSPIDLHVYDSQNRHSGPTNNGDVENNIPGVDYEVIDGNKFAFLPNGENYEIVGSATAAGSFNARIEKIEDSNTIETKYFNQVPLQTNTQVIFDINSNTSNHIFVDSNGDGIFETLVSASSVLNSNQSQDIIKPITTISLKGNKTTDGSYISSVQVMLKGNDENSGILKTQYSINNGQTWINYIEPFTINTRGGVTILYKSIDKAGNIEVTKTSNVNIIYPANSGNKK